MAADARREQILDVAHAIVDADGFHAATPNRIADAAGVTRPVLYQQFGDLAGLFVALVDRESSRAGEQFIEALGRLAPGADPFLGAFEGALHAIDAHPATWRLFLIPPEGAPPELHRRLAESRKLLIGFLERQLRVTIPGLPDPEYTAHILYASGQELLRLRVVEPERATTERLLDLMRRFRNSASP